MVAEDHKHYATDAEALGDCSSGGDTAADYSDGGDDVEYADDTEARCQQKNYSHLKETDILQFQENDVTTVSTVLSISRVAASILLRHHHWSVSKVCDAWFADEGRIRKAVGLLEMPVLQFPNDKELTCGICFESYPRDGIISAACGHPFCKACWRAYMSTSIDGGPGCLMLRCPDQSCGAAVGQYMINLLVSDDHKEKYARYLLRSYIEANRKTKWCPAPGCEYAVDFVVGSGGYDVSCLCSHVFCWNCTKEAHRPVDCGTVVKWILKNSAESENMNWILANSKRCPKCKRPIEKNQGCMHMTCASPCKFEFCCMTKLRKGERWIRTPKRDTHYYERWATNQLLEKLSDKYSQPESQLKFITEAWRQIVECRRVLKWTYAYGYYLPEQEQAKRRFFEYLQGEAEAYLERFHHCAEKDLQNYINGDTPSNDFNDFRTTLAGLTSVTRDYFGTLVEYLENGLSDVDSQGACSKTGNSKVDWPEREKAEEERELRALVRPVEMQMIREVGHAINALI